MKSVARYIRPKALEIAKLMKEQHKFPSLESNEIDQLAEQMYALDLWKVAGERLDNSPPGSEILKQLDVLNNALSKLATIRMANDGPKAHARAFFRLRVIANDNESHPIDPDIFLDAAARLSVSLEESIRTAVMQPSESKHLEYLFADARKHRTKTELMGTKFWPVYAGTYSDYMLKLPKGGTGGKDEPLGPWYTFATSVMAALGYAESGQSVKDAERAMRRVNIDKTVGE